MPGRKTLFGLYGTSFDSKRWLSLDVCGWLGISLSWSVHLYAITVLALKVISHQTISIVIYATLYVPVALLAMASLYQASTTNPGAVPLGARPFTIVRRASSGEITPTNSGSSRRERAIRRCHKCNDNYKPARAHHDSVSGRCIVKFDHFCMWVNNSVGAINHKFFCLFLLYTALSCLLSLVLLILRLVHCGTAHKSQADMSKQRIDDGPTMKSIDTEGGRERWLATSSATETTSNVYSECNNFYGDHFVIGLVICSLVFLVFTVAMGCEQLEAIETGKGKIARMKARVGSSGTEYERVTEHFNEMFGGDSPRPQLHWFLPTQIQFPRGMKQVVLGYEFNETCAAAPYQEPGSADNNGDNDNDNAHVDLEAAGQQHRIRSESSPPSLETNRLFTSSSSGISNARDASASSQHSGASDSISLGSIKNRRANSGLMDGADEEGISLVERTKTRLA